MSSDSDDDYCYTNSVSMLKALTKKPIDVESPITSKNGTHSFDFYSPSTSEEQEKIELRPPKSKESESVDLTCFDDKRTQEKQCINDSCVILSDEENNLTPVDIISTIDSLLEPKRGGRRKRGRGSRGGKRGGCSLRRSKRRKTSLDNLRQTIDSPEVYVVEEDKPDDLNYEITIKIFWRSQYVEKIQMKRFETFEKMFKHFSSKENIPENRLIFILNENIISKKNTPYDLNVTAASIIEGGILSDETVLADSMNKNKTLGFKIQLKDRKNPLFISIRPEDKMEILMSQCAEKIGVSMAQLRFEFDGDLIRANDTPENLGLEDGEIIDCIRRK